ncbi:hypothetical protein EDB92DRAFT_1951101 [Lactarius akahatsu]|uniref:Uncharacterized protein n=1 Tax=Lactarius akahatsu TaxID=416441 RepID=A0AAD4LC57_9AGAM|nr:hypothetical protein EDB92DRAFT_1951101 [Lactarius akahatsu]
MALSRTYHHYDIFREELAKAYPAFGHALWEPNPGEYPPVEVGDVGFIRQGKFHRLFNALHSENHPSNQRFGVPEDHEQLQPVPNHIDRGALNPNTFYSYGVSVVSGGLEALSAGSIGSAEVSFSCTKKQGAVLTLPVAAQREDTLTQDHFRKWITTHIDSWFAFTQKLGLGTGMGDIILVTGYHRTRSWSNITFNEVQTDAQFSLGVEVAGAFGASVNWRASSLRIQGAVPNHGPSGENLPENQCIFIRGFRVKRNFRKLPRIKAAAEPEPDPRGGGGEPEKEVVWIPSVTELLMRSEYRDPLHVLLEYIAKNAPHCDMALVHDDDLERILGVGDKASLEIFQPGEVNQVMDYLERSRPEIESTSHSSLANDTIPPRTDMGHVTVAMLSAQLKSLDIANCAPLCDIDLVHDDNRERILGTDNRTLDATMDCSLSPDALADASTIMDGPEKLNLETGAMFGEHPLVSERPDKPLVVKCDHNARRQKLSFPSARYCSYDGLKEKIEKHFTLSAQHFTIQWKDHDGEENYIQDEVSLDEAIEYYHSGDEGSVRSSGSAFASRSSSRHHKITMFVQVDSLDESQFSFFPGELSSPRLDDDAILVSSKDTRHRSHQGYRDSSSFRNLLTGGAHSQAAGSSSRNSLPRKPRIFGFASRASYNDEVPTGRNIRDNTNGRSLDYPASPERADPNDPFTEFTRLKLEEQLDGSLPHEHPSLQTDMWQAWLQDQSNLTKTSFGVIPALSTSDDTFSLHTSSSISDGVVDMDILLQRDEHGKYYYNYMGSGSSESAGDSEYEALTNESQSNNDAGIPQELLIPQEVTGCDECGRDLDRIKYTCTTCGEKTPTSRAPPEAAAATIGKGRSRESLSYVHHRSNTKYNFQEPAYPRAHRVPITPHFAASNNTPTQTVLSRSTGSQMALVPSSSSGSSSSTACAGYELCNMCFTKAGVDHSSVDRVDAPSSPPLPQISSELAIARRSVPKQKGQLRHAFVKQIWGFQEWRAIEQDEMSHQCSGCQSVLPENRYKCGICDNFQICRACFSDVRNIHSIHPFLEMGAKLVSRTRGRSKISDDPISDDNVDEPSLKHLGVQCFNCQQDIVGARFRCVDCTNINIDICSNCETAGLPGNLDPSNGGHSSSHIMLKIPVPLSTHEAQNVSRRAHGLRHGRDLTDLRGVSPLMHSSPGSISSLSTNTLSYGNESRTDREGDDVHPQICNACDEPMIGVRYQCLNCPSKPSSFNLCSDCEVKSYKVHDPMHVFLKVHRPVDIPGPLYSEFPLIPILYRDPAGPLPGGPSANIPGDPAAYLRDLTHAFALCDRHMRRIVGKWYRCALCATDLCADCEVHDTHNNTHLFLVFKAPVDMQAFRIFADLENPAGSPPVLHGNVYYPRH